MMHCKKSRYINNGLCLTDMQKCVKERCNQWQPYTNYDRIRNMSVEEMAIMLANEIPHGDCYGCKLNCCDDSGCVGAFRRWLESEVTE